MEIIYRLLKRIICPVLLPVLLLFSCKKETPAVVTNQPVVQAYLIPGTVLTVKLYKQKVLTDTSTFGPAIPGQKLSVSDGTTTVSLTETSKGVYTYADTTFLVTGKTYTLSFVYNSVTVSAKTTMPAKPVGFTTLYDSTEYTSGINGATDTVDRFTWQNPDSLNHILVFVGLDGKDFPVNSYFNGSTSFEENTKQKSVYYVLPGIFTYYAHYNVYLYTVNQEYITLLNYNTSGSNSQNLLDAPTNVVNGLGIFTAMQGEMVQFGFL